jgi:RNA polymerase sigma factor (sigma-70 family)
MSECSMHDPDDAEEPPEPVGGDAIDAPPVMQAELLRPAVTPDELQLQAWLGRVVRQDEAALADLYRATIGRVYGLALRIVRNPELAEEVAEDTFWQVWRQAPRFDPKRGTALAWVLTMARSRAIDALRARQRAQVDTVSAEVLGETLDTLREAGDTPDNNPHDLLQAMQGHQQLHRALEQLEAIPRQMIALAFFRGLTHEEISGHTGLPLGTVKSHIRRALNVLRLCLGPHNTVA